MQFKGTFALFGLLVVLGLWVYWTDIRGREERELAAEEATLAFPTDYENIRRIRVVYPDRSIEGVRNDGEWEFVFPPGLEADSSSWDVLASNVPRIEREETIASEPTDLSAFGLDSPSIGVGIELEDGREEEILFGRENPGGTHYYAKLASSDEVFLAPSSWISTVSKEVNDLRDKTVMSFDQDAIDRIDISGGVNVSLILEGEQWALETPITAPAMLAEVSTFLGTVGFARATDFAGEELTDEQTGLDSPRLSVVLHDGVTDLEHVLLIGGQPDPEAGSYYARDTSRDAVLIVNSDIVENAEQRLFAWRDKTIAEFDRPSVTRVRFERQEDSFVLTRGPEGWELPDQRPAKLDTISLMFNAVEFERITDIIDVPGPLGTYGLDPPRLRVVFEADGDETLAFGFGDDVADGEELYWKSASEVGVKVVSKDVFDRFNITAEDLLDAEASNNDVEASNNDVEALNDPQ